MDLPLTFKISRQDAFNYLLVFLSACLIMVNKGGVVPLCALAILSVPLFFNPAAIVPLLYLTSWHNSFALRPVVSVHQFYGFLFFFSLLLPRNRKLYEPVWGVPFYVFIAVPLMFWVLLTSWQSVTGDMAPGFVVFFELALLVLMTKVHLFNAEFSRRCTLLIIVAATVCFTLIALFNPIQVDLRGSELPNAPHSDIRLTVIPDINPNIASRIITINFIILFAEACRSRCVGMALFSLLNMVPVMLCGSRTSFLGMVFAVVLAVMTSRRINWKTVTLAVTSLMLLGVLYTVGADLNDRKEMTVSSIIEDSGSGRLFTIVGLFSSVIPSHLLMGIGLGRDNFTQMGFGYDADNLYVDALAQIGLVGFLLLFLLYFVFMGGYLSRHVYYRDKLLARLILIVFLILGIGISMFDTMGFWFALSLLIFFRNSDPLLNETRWRIRFRGWKLRIERKDRIVFSNRNTQEV